MATTYWASIFMCVLNLVGPSDLLGKAPMIGVELDSSFHYEPSKVLPERLCDLLLPERVVKEGAARVVMVGRFEGPSFSKDGRKSKFQHSFFIMSLEKAEDIRSTP